MTASSLILASASPRRQELLRQIGVQFTVAAQDIDESLLAQESPGDYVRRVTRQKAEAALVSHGDEVILAADTSVVCAGEILGKPQSQQEAVAMLMQLSGREHEVLTAVTVAAAGQQSGALAKTVVRFREISEPEARRYWQTGEPEGKAGGYAIQGLGAVFVESLTGSYSSVVGLPLRDGETAGRIQYHLLAQGWGELSLSEEILINVTLMETRVALIENGLLQEIFIERHNSRGHVGDVFRGKVARVMPGMEAAFVDIGLERAAFIHASDIVAIDGDGFEVRDAESRPIQEILREGQSIVVQVAKDAISTKGARLTTHLTLPSRNLVYMPRSRHVGISQRLEGDKERERLLEQLKSVLEQENWDERGGFIIRTAAEGASAEELAEDVRFLRRLWAKVEQRIERKDGIKAVYREVPLYMRTVRDLITPEVEKIRVDNEDTFTEIRQFLEDFVPELDTSVELYAGDRPIFDLYGIEDDIDKALGRQVKLKSGGDLIIDQTEAMTTIDVNTGGYLGSRNHAETILKTNLEAAIAIARQLRVRNLGGIIIIDFIDMLDTEHQRQLQRTFAKALEKDHARTTITGISQLGLIEMTRKRTRESLGQILNSHCPVCEGRGTLKSAETVCYEIFREILNVARNYENDVLLVMASQVVVDRLLDEESDTLAGLEELVGKTVKFEVEPMYTQEQFDVVLY